MPSVARTAAETILAGKEIIVLIEKVNGSGNYIAYNCITGANFTNPGITTEKTACRGGVFKVASGDQELPTVAIESLFRYLPSGQVATNVSETEIYDYVTSGEIKNVKVSFGIKTGDMVLTGPAVFHDHSINGPQSGNATGGVTLEFTEQPVKSTVPA